MLKIVERVNKADVSWQNSRKKPKPSTRCRCCTQIIIALVIYFARRMSLILLLFVFFSGWLWVVRAYLRKKTYQFQSTEKSLTTPNDCRTNERSTHSSKKWYLSCRILSFWVGVGTTILVTRKLKAQESATALRVLPLFLRKWNGVFRNKTRNCGAKENVKMKHEPKQRTILHVFEFCVSHLFCTHFHQADTIFILQKLHSMFVI